MEKYTSYRDQQKKLVEEKEVKVKEYLEKHPETIIALAQSLELSVIAEGVETQAQRDFLARSGCNAFQGYFFSRALPLEGFEEFALRSLSQAELG